MAGKRLFRSRTNRMIGGVVSGLAVYLGVDATLLRVIYAIVTLLTGVWFGVLIYFLAMIIVPEEPYPVGWVPAPAPPAPAPPVTAPPAAPSPAAPAATPPAPSGTTAPPEAPPVPPAPTAP